MGGKKNKKAGSKTSKKKKSKSPSLAGGLLGQLVPAFGKEANKVFKDVVSSLKFPTSGATAMASPNLALGYNNSMALSAPAANGTYVKHGKARTRNSKSGVTITHREYIQDVTFGDPGDFFLDANLPINPGNITMFPWLAGIATRYETYRFERLAFIYEPQCGTDNDGTVMMAVDFDAVDNPPVDKLQFMTYDGAVRSPPWFASVYECAPYNLHKMKEYFITRDLIAPAGTDPKTYFCGNLFLATQSQAAAFTSGELYVEYTVRLSTPQLNELQSVAGRIVQATRSNVGTWNIAYDTGELDLIRDYAFPNSILNANYIIPNVGAYLVIAVVQAQNNVGNLTTQIETAGPPTGISMASKLFLYGEYDLDEGFSLEISILINLTDPVWFVVASNAVGQTATSTAMLFVLPLDTVAATFLGPFATPPVNPKPTRFTSFLRARALHHKGSGGKVVGESGSETTTRFVAPKVPHRDHKCTKPKMMSSTGLSTPG